METLKDLNAKIAANSGEMIRSLSELISIPSVAFETGGGTPFGENVQKAFEYMLTLAEKEGFETYNADNYGGHIDFRGTEEGIIGVIGHLDVVPEGDGWKHDPYSAVIEDGYMYGRGTTDDKGPVMASFYAMKALKDAGYRPKKTIRLILGLDEETNWHGMDYYLDHVDSLPDCGFTPDADFPAINGEMGIIVFDIACRFGQTAGKGLQLTSLKGGNAPNCVADSARAVIYRSTGGYAGIKEKIAGFSEARGFRVSCRGAGRSLEIVTEGVSAHGATPEQGLNAVSIMMELLGMFVFEDDRVNTFISFYNEHIGYDLHGERIGCGFEDDISGKLIFNVGLIEMDRDAAKLTVNVRYPVKSSAEAVYEGMMPVLDKYELGLIKGQDQEPIFIPEDDVLITTLMDIYAKHTGDTGSGPVVIGGGTYARAADNIVAFGARFPGEPELAHQRNERISVDGLVKLTEIYAEAVCRLSEL